MSSGSFSLGSGVMSFGGDDAQFQRVADRVERAMKGVADKMRDATAVIDQAWSGAGKSIDKASEKTEGLLIKFGKLSLAATAAKHVGQAFEEMSVKIATGKANLADLIDEAVKGIP